MSEYEVHHDPEQGKFYVREDGKEALMSYKTMEDNLLVYNHTYVPQELRGKGLAGKVVKTALEYARAEGYKVVPGCSYVRNYLERHPEYRDVVDTNE